MIKKTLTITFIALAFLATLALTQQWESDQDIEAPRKLPTEPTIIYESMELASTLNKIKDGIVYCLSLIHI